MLGENCYSCAMTSVRTSQSRLKAASQPAPPIAHVICEGQGWKISDVHCTSGPQDKPFEEQHHSVSIAAVIAGSFNYRCSAGSAMLFPGALLLGNQGACFTCGHEHSTGDRCVAIQFAPEMFAELAACQAGSSNYQFRSAMLPAMPKMLPFLVEIEALTHLGRSLAGEELALKVGACVAKAESGIVPAPQRVTHADQCRISRVLRYIEERLREAITLDQLASCAAMSKFHFLRVFQRVTGQAPYQYVVNLRLRHAAVALRTTQESVSTVALAAGFGDLSTFNHRFRSLFGQAPSRYRLG